MGGVWDYLRLYGGYFVFLAFIGLYEGEIR